MTGRAFVSVLLSRGTEEMREKLWEQPKLQKNHSATECMALNP